MRTDNQAFIDSVLNLDDLLDSCLIWIANHRYPEDVFDSSVLERWAFDNGYIKEE